jgi:hypothetical protein
MFRRFIASRIWLHCLNALTEKKILTHRSNEAMNWQFPKKFVIAVISITKPKNIVVFAFTYVMESFELFYGDFCMDLHSVVSDEAMKRGNEALNASSLQFLSSVKRFIASSLQFFLSIKRFIAVTFYIKHIV